VIGEYKFKEEIDYSSEDFYSDDELKDKVKMKKAKERIRRADLATENVAITEIITDT
jgi:hypothetical protein